MVIREEVLQKGSTPKLVRAEPKNTGESLPWRTRFRSKFAGAPSSSSISSGELSRTLPADELDQSRIVQLNLGGPGGGLALVLEG